MSKVNELLLEYCPDGVPFRKLGEIGSFYGGLTGKSKEDFKDGNAVFITYMNVYSNIELKTDVVDRVRVGGNEKQNTVQYGDVLFTGSSETPDECGMSSVLTTHTDEKLYLNSFCFGYRFNDPSMFLPGFTKHLFRSDELRRQITRTASGVTRFNVSKKKMEGVTVPVPPLEVQREIVRVLDNFTFLSAELSAELSARKKQYEYYLNDILVPSKGTPEKSLKDLCLFIRNGMTYKADKDRSRRYKVSRIETISNGTINLEKTATVDNINTEYRLIEGDILFSHINSMSWLGNTAYYQEKIGELYHGMNLLCFRADQRIVLPKYLFYIMHTQFFRRYVERYAKQAINQASLSISEIAKWKIPVPTIEEQKEIIKKIDKFNELLNDISNGLPAEIGKRQQQYEYYRDQLLTFTEIMNEVSV